MKKLLFPVLFLLPFVNFFSQTTLTLSVSQDVAIGYHDGAGTANNNYGSAIQNAAFCIASAVAPPPGVNVNRALIAFNLSAIPANATVTSAFLNLYATGPYGSVQGHFGNSASFLERITQSWQEFTATWNNQPNSTNLNSVLLPQATTSTQDYLNINVFNLVQDMINNPTAGYGFKLRLVAENVLNGLIFCSKDHQVEAKRPKLVVTYIKCDESPQLLQSNLSICSGNSATVFATGASSNIASWYTSQSSTQQIGFGSSFTTPVLYGSSSQIVYNYYLGTCDGSPRPAVSLSVNPLPIITATKSKDVICRGQPITLSALGAISYSWSEQLNLMSTSSFMVVSPLTSTTFLLQGADANNCIGTTSVSIIVSNCTGLTQETIDFQDFSIYPNPSNGLINISFLGNFGAASVLKINDVYGNLIKEYHVDASQSQISINDMQISSGVYFCTLISNENLIAKKKIIVVKN
jgi:hypothetical protein